MAALFLIILYVGIFSWWIQRSRFFELPRLSKPFIGAVFLAKVFVGISYGFIHKYYFSGGDTCVYFEDSYLLYSTFWDYPSYYIHALLGWETVVPNAPVFTYPPDAIFWKDFGTYALVHFHAILQTFSFGYYSVLIVFVAMISLLASLNFYKVFRALLDIPHTILVVACFFLPSVLFWTSGLHKDVYVYLGLSLLLLGIYRHTSGEQAFGKIVMGILIVALARYYLLVLLIPATLGYLWSLARPKQMLRNFGVVYSVVALVVVLLEHSGLPYSFLEVLVNKQHEFLQEVGNSSISSAQALEPSFLSVLMYLPQAVFNVLFRPLLWECQDFLQVMASLEAAAFVGLIVLSLFIFRKKKLICSRPLVAFMGSYAISNLLLIGVLVSNVGTIVRYRAIAMSFLVMLLLNVLDIKRIKNITQTPKSLPSPSSNKSSEEQKEEVTLVGSTSSC